MTSPIGPPADNSSSTPKLDYGQTPRGAHSRPIRVVCWIAIFVTVALVMWSNLPHSTPRTATTAPSEDRSNASLPLMGRFIIGAHAALQSGEKADPLEPLIAQLDTVANTPEDKLRVAIVSGEVDEPAQAQKRINKLLAAPLPAEVRQNVQTIATIDRDGPDAISSDARQRLIDHLDWFGTVALVHGLPDDSPQRATMLAQAKRAYHVVVRAGTVGLLGLCVGCVLLVLAIVCAATGRIRLAYTPPRPDSVLLEAFTIYLLGYIGLSMLLHRYIAGLGSALVLTILLPIAVVWPMIRGWSWAETRQAIGWHTGRGVFQEIAAGISGYLAAVPLLGLMLIFALILSKLAGATPSHPIVGYVTKGGADIALLYFVACIWAPVIEETMFRGALFSHLRARHGWILSALVVGFLFAAVHPQGWTLIPVLGGIGVAFCGLRQWRGSIIGPMAAHALNNGLVMTLLILAMG